MTEKNAFKIPRAITKPVRTFSRAESEAKDNVDVAKMRKN